MDIIYIVATVIMIILIYETILKVFFSKEKSAHEHKYGTVQKDGYQYCLSCHSARSCGAIPCSHVWKTVLIDNITQTLSFNNAASYARTSEEITEKMKPKVIGVLQILQCTKCGDIKNQKIEV